MPNMWISAVHAAFMASLIDQGGSRGYREIRALRRAVLWRREGTTGAESFVLSSDANGWFLDGTVVTILDQRPAHIHYGIACDPGWRTVRAEVVLICAGARRKLRIAVREPGIWFVDGIKNPSLRGCLDVDLEISPSTNTLPIRRLAMSIGEEEKLAAAWVRFPRLTVEPLAQTYTRTGSNRYRYSSGALATDIEVDDLGLVTRYGGGWSRAAEVRFDTR